MALTLPHLPYEIDALEPHISKETLQFHHGKHHQAYVTNGNKLIADTKYNDMAIEDIICQSAKNAAEAGIFNNAAQVWNHSFYWNCMKPNGGGTPNGALLDAINKDFGDFENFKKEFSNAGATQFGSGWAWLVVDNGKLKITKTPNAGNPLTQGQTPILTMDVWEHAYYIDFRNRRPDYMSCFLDKLVNWDFVAENYTKAIG
jgi:superoxide dismutase, Fe-Mn family